MEKYNIDLEKERLSCKDFLTSILKEFSSTEMLPICVHERSDIHDLLIFSALIPLDKCQDVLNKHEWDMSFDEGMPSSCIYGDSDTPVYLRYGNDDGFEPIVLNHNFYGVKPNYVEVVEEFRLFHKLYHDRKTGHFIKISDEGQETIVVEEREGNIKIRAKELRQFLAIKEMCLSIQFDCREYSQSRLSEIGEVEYEGVDKKADYYTYSIRYGNSRFFTNDSNSHSIIMGKRIIMPLPKSKSGMWGFDKSDERKEYVDFIIGEDNDGEQIIHISNPGQLANFFGANPEEPNYLTPVHFRNEVLDKYRNNSTKYSVENGLLRCGSLWSMQMDTGATDKVVAWLGDLGRDLPYEEQLHWRSCNILPLGKPISDTYFNTQLMAQFTDPEHPVSIFKATYEKLNKKSHDVLDYEILLSLRDDDQHYLSALKLLTCDEQKEFDEQILALSKILIDSLNEKQLKLLLKEVDTQKIKGSIGLLEKNFELQEINGDTHIQYLRDLQSLRSSSSAHRKGKNYQNISKKLGLNVRTKSQVFQEILQHGISYLKFLDDNICLFDKK